MPDTFKGYASHSHEKWSDFKLLEFKPKPWGEYDIDIKIECCGVCGSDVHKLSGGWSVPKYPLVVGHEIVGIATRVGSAVTSIKVGDRVGVGAQIGCCDSCEPCKTGNENYCLGGLVDTYDAFWPDGTRAMGGYSNYIRSTEKFTFNIPEGLDSELAAPMLCAGLTVYSPMKRKGVGPGKKVGIVGIGGLGHFGVMFAAAMGAEVYAISHSASKEADAKKMGAKHFVLSNTPGWEEKYKYSLDTIISTSDAAQNFPIKEYLSLLKVNGEFVTVGFPNTPFPPLSPFDFAANGSSMSASHIGNHEEMKEMLALAAKAGVKSWIQTVPLSAEGCKKAVEAVHRGGVRYRYVLSGIDKHFEGAET